MSEMKLSAKFIEAQLLTKVDLKVVMRKYLAETMTDNKYKRDFTSDQKSHLSRQLNRIKRNQKYVYTSLLDGLADTLSNPKVSMYSKSGRVSILLKKAVGERNVRYEQVNVTMGGKELSEETIRIKESNPKFSKTYWKHTGRLARAFKMAVNAQKRTLTDDQFMTPTKQIVEELSRRMISSRSHVTAKANVEVKVPNWSGANADLMDDLITKPFVGVKPKSMYSYIKASAEAAQKRLNRKKGKV